MVSIVEIGVSQNTKCDNLVIFPKSGHIAIWYTTEYVVVLSCMIYTERKLDKTVPRKFVFDFTS